MGGCRREFSISVEEGEETQRGRRRVHTYLLGIFKLHYLSNFQLHKEPSQP